MLEITEALTHSPSFTAITLTGQTTEVQASF